LPSHGLLAETGWTRGDDGVLRRGGERFGIEVSTLANSPAYVARITAVADQLKQGGLEPTVIPIPSNSPNAREVQSRIRGIHHRQSQINEAQLRVLTAAEIPTPETLWQGTNPMHYTNPVYERLYAQFISTFEATRRQEIKADMLKVTLEDVAQIPLLHERHRRGGVSQGRNGAGPRFDDRPGRGMEYPCLASGLTERRTTTVAR
jgi:peptide/nickel transport system substrate-binding protein